MLPSNTLSLDGQRFGKLTAVEYTGSRNRNARWRCACDCGKEIVTDAYRLRSGRAASCGCSRRARHKYARTIDHKREYAVWRGMTERCTRPKHNRYSRYGGRGITVCERWHTFGNFLADMGPRPPGMSIDRINNDGDYEPGNCRWATAVEQGNNRFTNHTISFRGEILTVAQWSQRVGLAFTTIVQRLRRGWTEEEALTVHIRQPLSARTECDNGHALTPENTYIANRGWRRCRTCHRNEERARSMNRRRP